MPNKMCSCHGKGTTQKMIFQHKIDIPENLESAKKESNKKRSDAGSNALNELSRFSMCLAPVDNKWTYKNRCRIFGLDLRLYH